MNKYRNEKDSIGEIKIPEDSLKGIQTVRGENNFPYEFSKPYKVLIKSLFQVKLASLETNFANEFISKEIYDFIKSAILEGIENKLDDCFNITMFQGGAGTSLNMNVNEVIANRALQLSGRKPGDYHFIDPLKDVNLHQSTNDVIPTAGKVAILTLVTVLENAILKLQETCQKKEQLFDNFVKPGRTQFQDAFPTTLGREFSAYASVFARDRWRIFKISERLREVNLGGTAIGTGFLAPRKYIFQVVNKLKQITGLPVARAENLIDATQNTDQFVESHGILTSLSSTLIKVSTDLRLMSSGPEFGFNEILLKPMQAGSTIMPTKVNPVIPEYVTSCSLRVNSNHQLITTASSLGSLELNPFIPIMIHGFLESMVLMISACDSLTKCINEISVNEEKFSRNLKSNSVVVYVLAGKMGYEEAGKIYKEALDKNILLYDYLIENKLIDKSELDSLLTPENILKLGF